MGAGRVFRLLEGCLVALFFIEAARVVFAILLSMTSAALAARQVDLVIVNSHLALVVALVLPWFSPRVRASLPRTLVISAILVAVARVLMAFDLPLLRLYSGIALMGFGGVYFASLLRANWRAWVSALVVGLVLDQFFRAADTYDVSLRSWIVFPVGALTVRVPWVALQGILSAVAITLSLAARRSTRQEPYEPALLTVGAGLALGGFWAVEMLVLNMPGVVARWTNVPYVGLVPWVLLATALPLLPAVRRLVGQTLGMFDERMRGWVWLLMFLLAIVAGNRLGGMGAAGLLIAAQFMAISLLWWIPSSPEATEVEQVGPSFSLGMFVFTLLVYLYSLTYEYTRVFEQLKGQGLIVVLVAAGLLAFPRLFWRDEDPWLSTPIIPKGVPMAFLAPLVVFSLIVSGINANPVAVAGSTLRVATYNINGGYDANQDFQLELVASTIEASLADVVVLQEVDAGRPVGYGVDQAQFLAYRLHMYHVYQPTIERLYGIAILSRWPIGERSQTLLPGTGQQMGALRVLLQEPSSGRSITVVGTQLRPGLEQERLSQLAVLLDLAGDAMPTVIAADLGASPDDIVYQQLLAGGFLDPDTALGIERGFTTPARNPTARHDYILIRGLIPLGSRQVDSTASDHRLVVVEMGWP